MIEFPAARVVAIEADRVTVLIPNSHAEEWEQIRTRPNVMKSGQMYVKIGAPRRPRTTGWKSQNHHVNGHCQQIAEYTGDSFDDVKAHVKREAIADGYPIRTTAWGDVVPQSEADASTVECALLIEASHRVASFLGVQLIEKKPEHGIVLPETGEI